MRQINTKLKKEVIDHSFVYEEAAAIESEMFREYAAAQIDKLRKGLDVKSEEVLDYVLTSLVYARFYKNSILESIDVSFPKDHAAHMSHWLTERSDLKRKYDLCGYCKISPEVFYFHHGLRFTNPKVLNYIKDKDILDCGSFIGDSVLVLKDYTDATIYCYEFSKSNIDAFKNRFKGRLA